jgi:hypothetical protein
MILDVHPGFRGIKKSPDPDPQLVFRSTRCSTRTKQHQYSMFKPSYLSVQDYVFLAVGRVGSTSENITQKVVWVEESVSSTCKGNVQYATTHSFKRVCNQCPD